MNLNNELKMNVESLTEDFSENMMSILNQIDQKIITSEEKLFIDFIVNNPEIKKLDLPKDQFCKFKAKALPNSPFNFNFFIKDNEIVIETAKIFEKGDNVRFSKGIYFKLDQSPSSDYKTILCRKKIYDPNIHFQADNQLTFMEKIDSSELTPRIYGHAIYQKEYTLAEDDNRPESKIANTVLVIFQKKYGKDLYQLVKEGKLAQLEFNQKISIAFQLAKHYYYLHSQYFTHSDTKLENIVLKQDQVRVIDWDNSNDWEEFIGKKFGTLEITPPEMLFKDDLAIDFDPFKAEVWSLGIAFWYLFSNEQNSLFAPAFSELEQRLSGFTYEKFFSLSADEQNEIRDSAIEKLKQETFTFPDEVAKQPKAAKVLALIKSMMNIDPEARPSAEQLKGLLKKLMAE